MVNLVTHRESKEARQRAHKLIEEVRKHKKIDGHYKFFCKIIGSRKRRCIVKDDNGKYDLDFQIVLTELENLKGKKKDTIWEKVKKVMAWLADKTVDVGIAIVPYLLSALA